MTAGTLDSDSILGMVTAMERMQSVNERAITLTFGQFQAIKIAAVARVKASNGHSFVTILKTRCQHCGCSPKRKTACGSWFQTFLSELDSLMLKRAPKQEAIMDHRDERDDDTGEIADPNLSEHTTVNTPPAEQKDTPADPDAPRISDR